MINIFYDMRKFIFIFIALKLFSMPKEPIVTSGCASFDLSENVLTINAQDRSIINWKDFSINVNEITKFNLSNYNSCILNKVIRNNSSEILGQLESNGKIILLNPNGILIGKDAVINTASFLASTLMFSDSDFLNNNEMLCTTIKEGSIINYGTINTSYGDVILLGHKIENHGDINAKNAYLASGYEMLIQPGYDKIFIKIDSGNQIINTGNVTCIEAQLKANNPYSYAIKNSGRISSYGIEEKDGKVLLIAEKGINEISGTISSVNKDEKGGKIHILGENIYLKDNAIIDVSSKRGDGEILIGGDFQGKNPDILNAQTVLVEKNVKIKADATKEGSGGKVILWSDQSTSYFGDISTKGGEERGNGGFIEISGKHLLYRGIIDTNSINGTCGTLLLDPEDINIDDYGGIGHSSPPIWVNPYNPVWPPSPAPGDVSTKGGEEKGNSGFIAIEDINIDDYEGIGSSNPIWTNPYNPVGPPSPAQLDKADLINALAGASVIVNTIAGGIANGDITILSDVLYNSANNLSFNANGKFTALAKLENSGAGAMTINADGDIEIGRPTNTIPATIISGGSITIGAITVGAPNHSFNMRGGDAGAYAKLSSTNGNIKFNFQKTFDNFSLIGSSNNNAYAEISAPNGNFDFNTFVINLTLSAGAGSTSYAEITQNSGVLQIPVLDTTLSLSGNGPSSYARINSGFSGGDIQFSGTILDSLSLSGGSGDGAYAEIKSPNGNVDFSTVNVREVSLISGSGNGSYTEISNNPAAVNIITFPFLNDNLTLTAGGVNSHARIQSGGGVSFSGTPTMRLIGGSGSLAFSEIVANNGDVDLSSAFLESVYVQGGAGSGSYARLYANNGSILTLGLKTLSLIGGIGSNSYSELIQTIGDLTINGIDDNIYLEGRADGSYAKITIPVSSNLTFTGFPRNVTIIAGSGANSEAEIAASTGTLIIPPILGNLTLIGNGSVAKISSRDSDLILDVVGSISLTNNALIEIAAGGPSNVNFLTLAGKDITLLGGSQIINNAIEGDLTLVCDNLFSTPPKVGPGKLVLASSSSINLLGNGLLRVYTSMRALNSIEGTLREQLFVPGKLYVDTETEEWGHYYPNSPGGFPFTIYYKTSNIVVPGKLYVDIKTEELGNYYPNSSGRFPFTIYDTISNIVVPVAARGEKFIYFHSQDEYISKYITWYNAIRLFPYRIDKLFIRQRKVFNNYMQHPNTL